MQPATRTKFRALLLSSLLVPAVLASLCVPAFACPCSELTVPANLKADINRREGLAYTRSREYQREFEKAIRSARRALESHRGQPGGAVVSDIDETLLDNREEIERHPDFNWPEFFAWMKEARAPVLKPTAGLLSFARRNGFAVFLITGRNESLRKATIENLVREKVAYDGLYMRAEGDRRGAEEIKVPLREAIEKMGFKIIVNIGDQYSDLTGGHAEDCEKLPNRMYLVE